MSSIRPECVSARASTPCVRGVTAYLGIYNAVKGQRNGLIHGRLHNSFGQHCAIGSYFDAVGTGTSLPTDLLEEVANVNDSARYCTPKQRRTTVMKWLRWKLKSLGYSR